MTTNMAAAVVTKPFDPEKYLTTPETIQAYVDDVIKFGDFRDAVDALNVIGGVAKAALSVGGWRPIEELPESNVPVLAAIQRVGGRRVVIRAVYVASKTVLCDEISCGDDFGEYDEDQDCYWCPEGWYEWNECEEVHWAVSDELVGWHSLPPPPASEEESA